MTGPTSSTIRLCVRTSCCLTIESRSSALVALVAPVVGNKSLAVILLNKIPQQGSKTDPVVWEFVQLSKHISGDEFSTPLKNLRAYNLKTTNDTHVHWKTLSNSCSCLGFMRTAHKCIQMILPSLTPSRGSGNASRFVKKLRGKKQGIGREICVYICIYIFIYVIL